ncbi:MAG: hypothetical protein KJ070_03995, partial [Verrucomicrobia bacterium]|nr:hypothetical protein [Verrucomicrobiota bacterium]
RTIREREPPKPSTRLSRLAGEELTTTAQRRHTEPPKLIHLVRGDLDWIVMKALEKDRARRYETANGLAIDVQRHLHNEPVIARPPSNLYRLQKLVMRNKLVFAASSAVVATALLAIAFLVVSNVRTTHERNQKDVALKEKAAALDEAHASEQRAKEELFASLRSQAQARRYSRQMGQRLESLAALTEASRIRVDASLRDEAIAAMALPDVRHGPKLQIARTNCFALACDPVGQRYAVLDYQGVLTVHRMENNQELHRFETGPVVADRYWSYTSVAFSPDGRYLAKMGDERRPELWLLESGEPMLRDAPIGLSEPTFSANRRWVALAGYREVLCFDLVTGRESLRWGTADRVHTLQFHPTDTRIAVGYKDQPWVSVYDATDGREITQLEVGTGKRMVVNWHPDGRRQHRTWHPALGRGRKATRGRIGCGGERGGFSHLSSLGQLACLLVAGRGHAIVGLSHRAARNADSVARQSALQQGRTLAGFLLAQRRTCAIARIRPTSGILHPSAQLRSQPHRAPRVRGQSQ